MPGRGDGAAEPREETPGEPHVERFLLEARAAGLIGPDTFTRLRWFLRQRAEPAPPAVRIPPMPSIAPVVRTPPIPSTTTAPAPQAAPTPSPAADWLARAREALVSDLAVHGLAYLGVFLVLAGTLGFLIFSFGSMSESIRPWTELAIPTVLFGSALFLRGRGAPVVATALGLVGGLLLPVVLFASYVDSVGFPPDFSGDALGWAVIATSLALAGAYALLAVWRPELSTRFLVAPMVWVALFGIGFLLQPPNRATFQSWTAAQGALVAIGVAGTAVVCAARPRAALTRDARVALIPGAVVAVLLTLVLPGVDGSNWWPYVVTGLATIVTAELLVDRVDRPVVQVVQALALALALYGVYLGHGTDVAGIVGVVGAVALLEFQERVQPSPDPLWIGLAVSGGSLLVTAQSQEQAPLAFALTVVALWAHVRHARPLPAGVTAGTTPAVGFLAIAASTGAAALFVAVSGTPAFLVLAVLAAALAGLVRGLRPSDRFLTRWIYGSSIALGAAVATSTEVSPAAASLTLALVALALFVSAVGAPARAWAVVPAVASSAWFALAAADVEPAPSRAAIAIAAAAVAGVLTWRDGAPAHVATAAWAVGAFTVGASEPGWWLVAVGAIWVLATASVTVAGELRGVGVSGLLRRLAIEQQVEALGPAIPPVLLLAGIAGVLVAGLDASGLIERDPQAAAVAFGVLGLVEAVATRALESRTPLREIVAVAAYGAAGVVVVAGVGTPESAAIALGLALATVVAASPTVRWRPVEWAAWAVSFMFVARAGEALGVATGDLPLILGVWATVLAVGGLVLDDSWAGRRPVGMLQIRDARLRAPVAFGIAVLPFAMIAALPGSDIRVATVACSAAAAIAAVALLLRLGSVTVVGYGFLTVAALALTPRDPQQEPWILVVWAAALMVVAAALRPASRALPVEARWDLPAAVVAAGAVCAALAQAPLVDAIAVTYLAAGALILATGLGLRSVVGIGIGAALMIVGAIDAGPAWGALALGLAAAGIAVAAVTLRLDPMPRLAAQASAAALFAGAVYQAGEAVEATWSELAVASMAGAVILTVAFALWWLRRPGDAVAQQLGLLGLGAEGVALFAAWQLLPDREPMAAVALVAAIQAAAAGTALRQTRIAMASPPLACAAWLLVAADTLAGSVMWWAAPIGLAALAVVAIARADRHRRNLPVVAGELVALEYAGMAAILVPPLVETVTISPVRGLIGIGFGLLIAGWGLVSRVRRRLFVGIGGVVGIVLVMILGQVAELIPRIEGPMLWAVIVGVGILLIVIATGIERGRAKAAEAIAKLDELLRGWE